MNRCIYCDRRVWFWQRQGWRVGNLGSTLRWHARCYYRWHPR